MLPGWITCTYTRSNRICATWLADCSVTFPFGRPRHAANTRAGNNSDATKDLIAYLNHARGLVEEPYQGLSLGGWLLLER